MRPFWETLLWFACAGVISIVTFMGGLHAAGTFKETHDD